MTDPSPSPNFLWWGATIVLELTGATLLWRLTGSMHWHTGVRLLVVWVLGAAMALGTLAAWVYLNSLFEDATEALPIGEAQMEERSS